MGKGESGFGQGLQKASTKHLGQGEFIEQVFGFFLFPLLFGFVYAAAGHHDMDMGVIIQATVMSMEYRGQADVGAKIFRIQPKVFQRAGKRKQKEGYKRGLAYSKPGI